MTTFIAFLLLLSLLGATITTVLHDRPRRAPRSHPVDDRFLPPGVRW